MQAVKSSGSGIESTFSKALWRKGLRFRKNVTKICGKPDIYLKKYNLVIFIDGDFWHGNNWTFRKHDLKSNQEFWFKKIERNMQRDTEVNHQLKKEGYIVLRFWGSDIKKNLAHCIQVVLTCCKRKT